MKKKTPLYDQHNNLGAKICGFAGYDMPIQYGSVVEEHNFVREKAGLFDVSHMGQIIIKGPSAAKFLSTITPSSFFKTPNSRAKYTVLTNETGGIVDDLIITRLSEDSFFAVINAACKEKDIEWMESKLPDDVTIEKLEDRALIALQGPLAQQELSKLVDETTLEELPYMAITKCSLNNGVEIYLSRLGYTGEDGFEISISEQNAPAFWNQLLESGNVKAIGLAARDSLRLEMGYPLYGNDIDDTTSPIQAGLGWVVSKEHDGFFGSERILKEKSDGTDKKRIGIEITGKGIAREHCKIYDNTKQQQVGELTSGGFSPSLQKAIGQGYVTSELANDGEDIYVEVRGRFIEAKVRSLPFIEAKTKSMKFKV